MSKTPLLAAVLATVLAGPAFAGNSFGADDNALALPAGPAAASTLTRAQVTASIPQSRAAGTPSDQRVILNDFATARQSQLTRAEVVADLARERRANGNWERNDEDALAYLVPTGPSRDREAVRAEARAAAQARAATNGQYGGY